MTRQEHIDLIRAACIEANPSDTTLRDKNSWQGLQIKREYGRPVRLADVLLAIDKAANPRYGNLHVTTGGHLGVISPVAPMTHVYAQWDLIHDDLVDQSDQCVAFLAELLAKH